MAKRPRKSIPKTPAAFEPSPKHESFAGLLFCFFLSGAAALIYQVLWTKALGLTFGHTAYALATVLAVFMGGLAAGSKWLGRWSDSRPRPLATYGWLELAVALSGAVSLAGIAGVRVVYHLLATEQSSAMWLLAVRFLGACAVLFVPTFFMGGTLPMLVRALELRSAEFGKRFARLYWVNTAGAVVGTLSAGFIFLPVLGMRATLGIAVILNVCAGLIALRLARKERTETPIRTTDKQYQNRKIATGPASARQQDAASAKRGQTTARHVLSQRILLICFAAVGATAMAYEIGWTRLLATQLGSSTYAFTIMLATFLTGIGLGSALFEKWGLRAGSQMMFAWTQAMTALASLAALMFFNRIPGVLASILSTNDESFHTVLLAQFAVSSIAMLPTAMIFGFNFPVVTLLVAERGKKASESLDREEETNARGQGASVGRAYAWNTLGAIVGAIAAGFWLLPLLGSFRLLVATATLNVSLAALLWVSGIFSGNSLNVRGRGAAFAGLGCSLLLLAVIGVVGLTHRFNDPAVATFNTLLYWNSGAKSIPLPMQQKAHMLDVTYWADGLNATISVGRTDDTLVLRTDGKTDASSNDLDTQLMLGHIGAVAHPAPRRVLVIGFGGGMTLSALARYPGIESLDCVEIEPAVVGAAPYLKSLNRDVLKDKRVHILYDDGRNFLFTTHNRYDLIVSEPSNPWVEGVASLFTREFYRAAQDRLAPGGIFVQWVQSYSLYPDDLRTVSATFLAQFRDASLWHGVKSDLLLVAPTPPQPVILDRMQTLWSNTGLRDDFERMGMERPEGLFGYYLLDDAALRKFAAAGRIDSDDRTSLEYTAPRSLLVQGLDDKNLLALHETQPKVELDGFSSDRRNSILAASAVTALNVGDVTDADRFVSALNSDSPTPDNEIARGRDAIAHADYDSAARAFGMALAADPNSVTAAWGLAEVNRLAGNRDLARQEFLQILERSPDDLRTLGSLEQLYSDTSHPAEAAEIQRRLIKAEPHADADAYAELGEMLKRAGKLDEAVAAMNECLARDPYNFETHLNLGQIFDFQKKYSASRENLEFVQRFFPDADAQPYALLYEVDNALGDPKAAAEAVRFGIQLFPNDPALWKLHGSL
jgi:spermidine synthase